MLLVLEEEGMMDEVTALPGAEGEEELFHAAISRPWLYKTIVERYEEPFLRRAKRMLGNEDDAEDAVQNTFVKIWKNAEKFSPKGPGSFRSWAYTVLINTVLTAAQTRTRRSEVEFSEELEAVLVDPSSASQQKNKEDRDHIESVLARMPEHLARALRRYFLEEKTQEEMALEDNEAVGAVKIRVHRAKKLFRKIHSAMLA